MRGLGRQLDGHRLFLGCRWGHNCDQHAFATPQFFDDLDFGCGGLTFN
jgi:hypothetical protein